MNRACLLLEAALALTAAGACHSEPDRVERAAVRPRSWLVPAPDVGDSCSDVGPERVCWSDRCEAGICLGLRVLPAVPALSPSGYRCSGSGRRRVCRDRTEGAGPFACSGEKCVQRVVRVPDHGEWSCSDAGGAVVCRELGRAAAVLAAPSDPGFRCGQAASGRVCVDFSPDLPDERAAWSCAHEDDGRLRVCRRSQPSGQPGTRCAPTMPCLDGLRCVKNRCLPERPRPGCTLDSDCPSGACRFGTCREAGG